MPRTITVKGTGYVRARVDYAILTIRLVSMDIDYSKAMDDSAEQLTKLRESLAKIGFDKEDLKTARFDVSPNFEHESDEKNNYRRVFKGYNVTHELKVDMGFESVLISKTIGAIADCLANPELDIVFTIKDTDAIKEELLRIATVNAKAKAEILAHYSGVNLGKLLTIDYNWADIRFDSNTVYNMENSVMPMVSMARNIEVEPEDIEVRDNVTFVWEIS